MSTQTPDHMTITPQPSRARRLRDRLGKVSSRPRPGWRTAALFLSLVTAAMLGWSTWDQYLPGTGTIIAWQLAMDVVVAFVAGGAVTGVAFVTLGRVRALPWLYVWSLAACLVVLGTLGAGASQRGWYAAVAVIVIGGSAFGGALGCLLARRPAWRSAPRDRRVWALGAAVAVLLVPLAWLLTAGQDRPGVDDETAGAATVAGPDPAAPGPFAVETLVYGSGDDARASYGPSVDVRTPTVDASRLVGGWDDRRRSLWGFDASSLPLNGMVWRPAGAGPFPLVLMVHGNKSSAASSEAGLGYLGELLASHGFIVAAIDQNFFNTGVIDRAGGLTGVNAARGWLVLEHLRVWEEWNATAGNPFTGTVDTERISLIGHSRGSEAIAVAAHLNDLEHLPGNASVPFDYGFGIRSLLALAPTDGQYLPDGEPIRLDDVDYLVLQGSHDADVTGFGGLDQYDRVSFTGGGRRIKAALFIGGANHGHFNTRWGSHDVGNGFPKLFLDTDALIPAADQRRIAQVYATSFLRTSLMSDDTYADLLRDPRAAAGWLPGGTYVNQFADSETDLVPAPAPGENTAPSWELSAGEPSRTVDLDPGTDTTPATALVFDAVVRASDEAAAAELTVRLTDAAGRTAVLPADQVVELTGTVEAQYLKSRWMHSNPVDRAVPQTYRVPLASFSTEPEFDATDVRAVTFTAENAAGPVLIDDIGLARG